MTMYICLWLAVPTSLLRMVVSLWRSDPLQGHKAGDLQGGLTPEIPPVRGILSFI
jgi:hypothetical protein